MFGIDWAALFKIVGIDILLGGDNAILIALACAALAPEVRNRAVMFGTAGAVVMRAILLVFASFLMGMSYVKFFAGAYLLYVGYSLLKEGDDDENVDAPDRLWAAVKTIIIADLAMSTDNVLAVAGSAQSAGAHSNLYAVGGILFSIPIIVLFSQAIMKLMDRFPVIVWFGAGLLGWVGAEMMITDPILTDYITRVHMTMGGYTDLSYKLAGFVAVVFTVAAARHINKRGELAAEAAHPAKAEA
ncbi:membrane protein [Novimethylophilus kurashikiensis]|uniref:Membrane protein n=1 Tax=Novimethylophilus kurashikiensis TaxID=1825523 RepID=A0A2R5F7V7_9PROT|nr:TerC family protein [Novimethylophilus kurashikiensis]GBG14277.1 membrane protein [Novimethylophilus kurashikiensis]